MMSPPLPLLLASQPGTVWTGHRPCGRSEGGSDSHHPAGVGVSGTFLSPQATLWLPRGQYCLPLFGPLPSSPEQRQQGKECTFPPTQENVFWENPTPIQTAGPESQASSHHASLELGISTLQTLVPQVTSVCLVNEWGAAGGPNPAPGTCSFLLNLALVGREAEVRTRCKNTEWVEGEPSASSGWSWRPSTKEGQAWPLGTRNLYEGGGWPPVGAISPACCRGPCLVQCGQGYLPQWPEHRRATPRLKTWRPVTATHHQGQCQLFRSLGLGPGNWTGLLAHLGPGGSWNQDLLWAVNGKLSLGHSSGERPSPCTTGLFHPLTSAWAGGHCSPLQRPVLTLLQRLGAHSTGGQSLGPDSAGS